MRCPLKLYIAFLALSSLIVCALGANPFKKECVRGTYPPKDGPRVPTYVVNLDAPAAERWHDVVKDKGPMIVNLLTQFKKFLLSFGTVAQEIVKLVDQDLGYVADTLPGEYGDEIKGIAKSTGLPLGEVVLYNIFYEVFTVCTSIVAADPTGKLYHARNLDFGLFMGWNDKNHSWIVTDALRPTIVNLEFKKSGKTLYKAVNFAGYIGIYTGYRPHEFSISMNERFNPDGGYIGIIQWILGNRDIHWVGFLARDTLQNAQNFTDAKTALAETPMLAPCYFILGGTKAPQASIITRSRDKALDVWDMGTRNSSWYLLETNYDNWKDPLFLDDRRTPGRHCMDKLTQKNVNFPGIFDVLSSQPVLNKLTTYTALMQVSGDKLETYIQFCPDPCFGW